MNVAVALPCEVRALRKSRSLNLSRMASAMVATTSAKLPPTSWEMKMAWVRELEVGSLNADKTSRALRLGTAYQAAVKSVRA
jgi:hypothetical protein